MITSGPYLWLWLILRQNLEGGFVALVAWGWGKAGALIATMGQPPVPGRNGGKQVHLCSACQNLGTWCLPAPATDAEMTMTMMLTSGLPIQPDSSATSVP